MEDHVGFFVSVDMSLDFRVKPFPFLPEPVIPRVAVRVLEHAETHVLHFRSKLPLELRDRELVLLFRFHWGPFAGLIRSSTIFR